jgi:ferredoxin
MTTTVVFEAAARTAVGYADQGARVIDICDSIHAPVSFSCRSANCGTCRVVVLEGAELLDPAGDDERSVLRLFASAPAERLACQLVVRHQVDGDSDAPACAIPSGLIRLRAAEP